MNIIISEDKQSTKLPKIMRAAIYLFVKRGVDATTIKDIAKEAGVAEGALYRHYKSKDELAWRLFSTQLSQFTTELTEKVFIEKGTKERIATFVSECFSAFEQDRDLFSYLILSEHKEFKKYPATYKHPGHITIQIIEEGQKRREVRSGDPSILGATFIGAVIRICVMRMYGSISKDLRQCVNEVADLLWTSLRLNSRKPQGD
jgi:AcrR family transcriptional regulator